MSHVWLVVGVGVRNNITKCPMGEGGGCNQPQECHVLHEWPLAQSTEEINLAIERYHG